MTTATEPKPYLVQRLESRCFVIMGADRVWQYQGQVHAEVHPGFFLVRYFDALMGEPNDFAIYPIAEMRAGMEEGCWKFFRDDEHLRDWIDRHPSRPAAKPSYQRDEAF